MAKRKERIVQVIAAPPDRWAVVSSTVRRVDRNGKSRSWPDGAELWAERVPYYGLVQVDEVDDDREEYLETRVEPLVRLDGESVDFVSWTDASWDGSFVDVVEAASAEDAISAVREGCTFRVPDDDPAGVEKARESHERYLAAQKALGR
jgi:hypothetical protein